MFEATQCAEHNKDLLNNELEFNWIPLHMEGIAELAFGSIIKAVFFALKLNPHAVRLSFM